MKEKGLTKQEELLIELEPRLKNWRRAYRDRPVRNISITYAVERALNMTREKKDFSMDYQAEESERYDGYGEPINQKDADLLNTVWRYLSTEDNADQKIGDNGLNVRTAKMIVLLYTFGPPRSVYKAGRKIWNLRRQTIDAWTQDALTFFALRIRVYEARSQSGENRM